MREILTARQEWSAMWQLPVVAMLGVAGSSAFAYSSGVLMDEIIDEFGWNRAQYSFGFTIQMIVGLVALPLAGRLIDRIGPRRVALVGIGIFAGALSLLGLATKSLLVWWILCSIVGASVALVGPTVWVTAVVGRFDASRGLAMAVVLSGAGVATAIWPVFAAIYIGQFGWRLVYPSIALTWVIVIFPLAYIYFYGPRDQQRGQPSPDPVSSSDYWNALKSRSFLILALAGASFASVTYGLIVHFVPIMREAGLDLGVAASVASLTGIFAVVGRIGTGYLLDRLPTKPLALVIFLLPIIIGLMLIQGNSSLAVLVIASIVLGLTVGAEIDVITFMAARRFGAHIFASVYAAMMAIVYFGASIGPLLAGALFDTKANYDIFLVSIVPIALLAITLICIFPSSPTSLGDQGQKAST